MKPHSPEYVLTIVQHTYCHDCMWLKNKITDVYHFSGIVRGEDSKHWHINIYSPRWNRDQRAKNFPGGFATVDVPAMKLEVDDRLVLATQDTAIIAELLGQLKWMLMNGLSNSEIENRLLDTIGTLSASSQQATIEELICAD